MSEAENPYRFMNRVPRARRRAGQKSEWLKTTLLCVAFTGFPALILMATSWSNKKGLNEVMILARGVLNADDRVKARIGSVERWESVNVDYHSYHGNGHVSGLMQITGTSGRGSLSLSAKKVADRWVFTQLDVLPETGEHIVVR